MELVYLAVGAVVLLVVVGLWWRRRTSETRASARAHEAAQERDPPVEIGETYEMGVHEMTDHHSGAEVAVGKVEGFVVFVEDVPAGVGEGDVVRARVLSFNEGHTSADATFVEKSG